MEWHEDALARKRTLRIDICSDLILTGDEEL